MTLILFLKCTKLFYLNFHQTVKTQQRWCYVSDICVLCCSLLASSCVAIKLCTSRGDRVRQPLQFQVGDICRSRVHYLFHLYWSTVAHSDSPLIWGLGPGTLYAQLSHVILVCYSGDTLHPMLLERPLNSGSTLQPTPLKMSSYILKSIQQGQQILCELKFLDVLPGGQNKMQQSNLEEIKM